jgi:peptidoglycan/LPS O-acetylase OafA/YrhL
MRRFYQVDVMRAIAVLMVALYHFWVVLGNKSLTVPVFNIPLNFAWGGEVGVTAFFMISGFGIDCSLGSREKTEFVPFFLKRIKRIYPQYIVSIIVMLLIGNAAVYLSWDNLKSVVTHIFFIHNFFISTHGSISGVLWTMGVTVQFYLISIVLYKLIKRFPKGMFVASIVVSVGLKALLYGIFETKELDYWHYFIYGRQLFSSLDNFVIGMLVAEVARKTQKKVNVLAPILSGIVLFVWVIVSIAKGTLYSNTLFGCTWHSITAVLMGFTMLMYVLTEINCENAVVKAFRFVGKYEYGIYIWHLLIVNNLLEKSPIVQQLAQRGFIAFALPMLVVTIAFGYLSEVVIDGKRS